MPMPTAKKKRAQKNPEAVNLLARSVAEAAIGKPLPKPKKAAITDYLSAIGRKGGLKGGKARAMKLSASKRKEIAQKGARKRWGKDTKS